MRVGIGYDIHRLVEDRKLVLCGVEIPYVKGLISYTDGDVVLHAICDAMLGAMALGDIGQHFPNTDPKYKNASSSEMAKKVLKMARDNGYHLNNIDTMIIAEEPKLYPFREKLVASLSALLETDSSRISLKATTNEGVGSIGRGDAIAAYAVVTLEDSKENRSTR